MKAFHQLVTFALIFFGLTSLAHAQWTVSFTAAAGGSTTTPHVGDSAQAVYSGAFYPSPASAYWRITSVGGPGALPGTYTYLAVIMTAPDGSTATTSFPAGSAGTWAGSETNAATGIGSQLNQSGTWKVSVYNALNVATATWTNNAYYLWSYQSPQTILTSQLISQTTFYVAPNATTPTVSVSPGSASVTAGQSQTYTATTSGTPTISLQWQFSSDNGVSYSPLSGATSTTFTVSNATTEQSGWYRCVATNVAGSASAYGSLHVTSLNSQSVQMYAYNGSGYVSSLTIAAGSSVTMQAQGAGTSYTFADGSGSTVGLPAGFPTSNASNGTITFPYTFTTAGTWTIYGHAPAGSGYAASMNDHAVTVTVLAPPTITAQPADQTITYGQSADFSASASGSESLSYQWYRGAPGSGSAIAGATTATLSVSTPAVSVSGSTYYVVVANSAGSSTSTAATLTVNRAALVITPASTSKEYGQSDPAFTWTANGYQRGDSSGVVSGVLSRTSGESVGSYALNLGSLSAGNYTLTQGAAANVTITKASLTVMPSSTSKVYGNSDPAFTWTATGYQRGDSSSVISGILSRASGESVGSYAINLGSLAAANYTLNLGAAAWLTVSKRTGALPIITPESAIVLPDASGSFAAKGGSTGNYVWSASAGSLSSAAGESVTWSPTGSATSAVVSVHDAGDATYVASANASASVLVSPASTAEMPAFITQPASVAVIYGGNADFSALATGNPAPSYRWERSTDSGSSWSIVAGATSTMLDVPKPPVSASGMRVRCVATNAAGSAISNQADLSVKPAQQGPLTLTPASIKVSPDAVVDFTVAGGATGNYSWSSTGGAIRVSTGGTAAWKAPATTGAALVTVVDTGDDNILASSPASASVDLVLALETQPMVTLAPVQVTTQTGLTVAFTAAGGAGTGAYVWTCLTGSLTTNGATATWRAPSTAGNSIIRVYREGDATHAVSNTASSTALVVPAGEPILTLRVSPNPVAIKTPAKLAWEGVNVLGGVNLNIISSPLAYMGPAYLGTYSPTGSQNFSFDVAGTYVIEAKAPVQGVYANATLVVMPPATTKMLSLTPLASTATIGGRSYNRLWNSGSTWYAYLGRSGLRFTATGQAENAVKTFELQAKSPLVGASFQTISTVGADGASNGAGVAVSYTFTNLMLDAPSAESSLVPASCAAGTPLTGVWTFRARVQDSVGIWSGYSDEVPVTAALPIAVRGDSLRSHPPAGTEGEWFQESQPKTYSFQLWVP